MNQLNCLLLVDDDKITNYLHERLLKKLNIATTIKTVYNGVEALGYIGEYCSIESEKCCPDLVFLDLNMPIMNGIEFLEEYKQMNITKGSTRIIVLSSSDNEADIEKVKNLGVFEYVTKPLTEEKLKQLFT